LNLLLFHTREYTTGDSIRVDGERARHLVQRGAQPGDCLRVGEIDGLLGEGTIRSMTGDSVTLSVQLERQPPQKLPLAFVVALPRPKMLRRILRTVAEFGVPELHLVNSYRVEKSYWQTPVLEPDTLRSYLLQGLAQGVDTVLPAVHCHRRFKPWVEDELPALLDGRRGLLAHPGDHPACPHKLTENTLVCVGPEGGFTDYEVEKLRATGCETVSLGARILRVENAVTALLGRMA